MDIISTRDLSFKKGITYPDICIREFEPTFITGPSGCGKTTLFRLINRSEKSENGKIFFKGEDIKGINPLKLRESILLVGQEPFLFEGSIKENFHIFYSYREMTPPDDESITELMKLTMLDTPIDTSCSILSGGQKQRVFIMIFLSFLPEVILLDEPSSALDSSTAESFIANIMKFTAQHKITPIIISHSNELVEKFSQNTIKLGRCER